MKFMTIGEIASRAGIQTSAIRYYERIGVLPPPQRVNGRRRYELSMLQRLAVIHLTSWAGFRMSEIKVFFNEASGDKPASADWHTVVAAKIAMLEEQIRQAQAMKSWLLEAQQCQCSNVNDCVSELFDEAGNATDKKK